MATAFVNGRATAHAARFAGDGTWISICSYRVERSWQEVGWTEDAQPDLPWCSWCAAKVKTLARDVLGVEV